MRSCTVDRSRSFQSRTRSIQLLRGDVLEDRAGDPFGRGILVAQPLANVGGADCGKLHFARAGVAAAPNDEKGRELLDAVALVPAIQLTDQVRADHEPEARLR